MWDTRLVLLLPPTHYTYPTTNTTADINGIIICTCAAPIRIRFQQIASLNCIAGLTLIQSHSEHEDNNSTNAIRSTVSTVHSFCLAPSQCNTPPLISVGHLSSDRQTDTGSSSITSKRQWRKTHENKTKEGLFKNDTRRYTGCRECCYGTFLSASVNGTGTIVLHIILQELCPEQNRVQWKTSQYIRC